MNDNNNNTDNRELVHQIELLKKDYEIMQANVDSTLNAMRTDIERINTDAAKRSDAQTKWIIGVGLALAALMLAFWGLPLLTAGN